MNANDIKKAEEILQARWIVRLWDEQSYWGEKHTTSTFKDMLLSDYRVEWSIQMIAEAKDKAKERLPPRAKEVWTPPRMLPFSARTTADADPLSRVILPDFDEDDDL
jgi:hypothetical protein